MTCLETFLVGMFLGGVIVHLCHKYSAEIMAYPEDTK
jgi:hypothetical protein